MNNKRANLQTKPENFQETANFQQISRISSNVRHPVLTYTLTYSSGVRTHMEQLSTKYHTVSISCYIL